MVCCIGSLFTIFYPIATVGDVAIVVQEEIISLNSFDRKINRIRTILPFPINGYALSIHDLRALK